MGTALVTGASAGLGVEFARLFAKDGHDLILVARRRDRLEQLAKELSSVKTHVVDMDLGVPGAGQKLFDAVKHLNVDYLVNNAGFASNGAFDSLPLQSEMQMIDLNVRVLAELCRLFLPEMKKRGSGRILNIGSTAGFQPGPYMSTYYASKAFVNSFSEALNEELLGTGVSCTVLAPGPTETEFAGTAGLEKSRLFNLAVDTPECVARTGYRAMLRGRPLVIAGLKNGIQVQLLRLSPRFVARKLAGYLNRAR